MVAVNTYQQIETNERENNDNRIVVLLFVRPEDEKADSIIKHFNYLHEESGRTCGIYAVGYSNIPFSESYPDSISVHGGGNVTWNYSDKAFIEVKNALQGNLKWRYSGEPEMLILQSNMKGQRVLDFRNMVPIDINYGIQHGYIRSFINFIQSLINAARREVEAKKAVVEATRKRYSPMAIVTNTINAIALPDIARQALKDSMFMLTGNMK